MWFEIKSWLVTGKKNQFFLVKKQNILKRKKRQYENFPFGNMSATLIRTQSENNLYTHVEGITEYVKCQ